MGFTFRQRALKIIYPFFIWAKQKSTKQKVLHNQQQVMPVKSFYSLSVVLANGKALAFERLKGKKVLLVNTASDCGYTPQYAELQKLYQHSREDLEIIAFPANDFKEQERGSDDTIAQFCSRNYGVSFPIASKTSVLRNEYQHPVFEWLTSKEQNGWNDKLPSWNFSKYLVSEDGILTHYFEPAVSPLSEEMIKAVHA